MNWLRRRSIHGRPAACSVGELRGCVVRARMASRGGARGGRAACTTRRGGGATREDKSAAVELIGVQTGAVRSTERCGTLARGQQRGGVGPGEAGEGRVAVQRRHGRPVGGNPRRRRPAAAEQSSGGAGGRRK